MAAYRGSRRDHNVAEFDGYLCRRRSLYPNETEAYDPSFEASGGLANNVRVITEWLVISSLKCFSDERPKMIRSKSTV